MTTPPAQALFQVAALLIPALLLAGGLVRRTDEALTKWYKKAGAWLMVLVVIAGVGGELVAINGALAVTSSEASIRIVVGVLAVGTIAIGLRTARHWVDGVVTKDAAKVAVYVVGLALGVIAVIGTEIVITDTVHESQAAQALTALQAASDAEQAAHGDAARDTARRAATAAARNVRSACSQAPGFPACGAAP